MKVRILGATLGLLIATAYTQQLRLSGLPVSGPVGLTAYGVSDDGQLVVGYGWDQSFFFYPVAWRPGQMPFVLPTPTIYSFHDVANGISGDGGTIVGVTRHASTYQPYPTIWRMAGSNWNYMQLPVFIESDNRARAASYDGHVVVGQARPPDQGNLFPARWRENNGIWQLTDVFTLGCPYGGIATGVSADGELVVGWACEGSTWYTRAFIARSPSEITVLPVNAPHNSSQAWGVNATGDIVVGWSYISGPDPAVPRACRWRRVGSDWVHELLLKLPDTRESYAYAVSMDGSIIVGYDISIGNVYRALIWINGQPYALNTLYASLIPWGIFLSNAYDVSPDGRYIVGAAHNTNQRRFEMFWLDRGCQLQGDVNSDERVDDTDLLSVLFAFGQTGSNLPTDVNRDGRVDDADLLIVLFNFGRGC